MNQAMATGDRPCGSCGGHGWKYLTIRRALARTGEAGEQAGRRSRVPCLACGGTGRQPATPSA